MLLGCVRALHLYCPATGVLEVHLIVSGVVVLLLQQVWLSMRMCCLLQYFFVSRLEGEDSYSGELADIDMEP